MCQRVQRFASGTSGLVLCFLQSKKKSWERTKELCLLQLCNHWHCFWTHLIVGHLFTWQQPKHKVLPTTKKLWHPWCHNDRPCLGNTHSNKTWVLHIPLLCFHYIVIQNDGTVFNLFASSGFKFPLGLKFHKLETTKNEAKFGYVLLWNDCHNPWPTSQIWGKIKHCLHLVEEKLKPFWVWQVVVHFLIEFYSL